MKTKEDQKELAVYRDDYRMKLFVETYLKSLHLNKVDPRQEALRAIDIFDGMFPPRKDT